MITQNSIFKIQTDYFNMLRESLLSNQLSNFLNLPVDELREYIKELFEPSGLVMPGKYYSRTSFENQFNSLLVSIERFWNRYAEELLDNLYILDSYKISMQSQHFMINLEKNVKKLGVYFDTITMVDPLHIAPKTRIESFLSDENLSNKLILSERLAIILKLSHLNTPDVDLPIFIVLPDSYSMNNTTQDSANELALQYINENIFKDEVIEDFDDIKTRIFDVSEDKIRHLIKNDNLLNFFVERFNKPNEKTWAIDQVKGSLHMLDGGFKQLNLQSVIVTILHYLKETIYNINETLGNSIYYRADPIIFVGNLPVYEWLQCRISEKIKHDLKRSDEEQIVANALIQKDLSFMEALTLDDLKALRQDGLMEQLREKLRIERKYLKSVSEADFLNSTEIFGKKVLDIVGEYSNEHQALKSSSKKRIAKSSIVFGGSAALGITGLACPSVEVLAIIGTATGLLLGGKSVLDLVSDFKQSKKEKQISESNPVSILFGAYERYMNLINDNI